MTETVANADQAAAWNGDDGRDWVELEARFNTSLRQQTRVLMAAAQIGPNDRVLDVGCGCGETTRLAGRAAENGSAHGLDISDILVARAREQAQNEGLTNVTFERGDAQVHPFLPASYDVIISRYGAMFFADRPAAFRNLAGALRPGGKLALLVWKLVGENPWMQTIRQALAAGRDLPSPPAGMPGPFGLADPDATRSLLAEVGFRSIQIDSVVVPAELGSDADDALQFLRAQGMVRGLLQDLDHAAQERALETLRSALRHVETPAGVFLSSGSWLITAERGT